VVADLEYRGAADRNMLARAYILAEIRSRDPGEDRLCGGALAVNEDRHDVMATFAKGAGRRLNHLPHLVLAVQLVRAAGIRDGLEGRILGAAVQRPVDVAGVVALDIAPDHAGDIGHGCS